MKSETFSHNDFDADNYLKGEKTMKKTVIFLLTAMTIFTLAGCGNGQDVSDGGQGVPQDSQEAEAPRYAEALDVLNEVLGGYAEEERFAIYGGDQENAVMDAPGKFDVSKTEELEYTLSLPEELFDDIDDAASMVHMMNANMFTGAVYHLKDSADLDGFADAVKSHILEKQWMCGQPDTLIVIDVDGRYVITAYGNEELIQIFKNHALSELEGSQMITEATIV